MTTPYAGVPACEQAKHLEETYTVDGFFGTVEGDSHDHDRSLSPHFSAGSPWPILPWVIEESEPDFRFIRELYEEKCLVGLHVASFNHSGAYVHLRLSKKGREIYHRLRAAFPSTSAAQ